MSTQPRMTTQYRTPTQHKARAPKYHTGTRRELRYIDCSCGWGGRITTLADAQAEHATHASGVLMPWEIDGAYYDAVLEDRRRQAAAYPLSRP